MATHCPGYEPFKDLQSYACTCPGCGATKEVFSDEIGKKQKCRRCGIDFQPASCIREAGVPKIPVGER